MYLKNLVKFAFAAGLALPVIGMVSGSTSLISSDSFFETQSAAFAIAPPDTGKKDSLQLPYPWEDNLTDPFSNTPSQSPLFLGDPSNVTTDVTYDPDENQYNINEKMGDRFYRNPTYLTFDEFVRSEYSKSTNNYWKAFQ